MNGFWGADAEALRTMGAVCARRAELLDELEGRLSAVIDTVEWVGEDAERFRADWSGSVRPGLQDRGLELRQQARRLAQHAEEQEAASSPDSFGGPWSSPGEFLADVARMAQGMLPDLLGGGSGPAGRFAEMLREALATPEGRAALLGAFLGSLLGGLLADLVLRGLALGMLLEELLAGLGAGGGLGNLIGEEGRLGEGSGSESAGGSGAGSESTGGSGEASSGAGESASGGAGGESGGGSGGGGAEGVGGAEASGGGAGESAGESVAAGGAMGLQGLVDGPAQTAGALPAGRLEAPGAEEPGTLFERLVAMIGEMLGGGTGGGASSPRGTSAIGEGIGWD
ncbi:hypothetical protein [Brachybacterium paraconglomeratum]|uniref:hypothetical protein n=1 Tax=Brachybacterium paraconglomeratum TaxID=173362 RepID=UPI003517DB8F